MMNQESARPGKVGMVERLRASRDRDELDLSLEGAAAGHLWAQNEAEYSELEALANQRDSMEGLNFPRWTGPGAWSPGELFYFYIRPQDEGDRDKAQGFWKDGGAYPGSRIYVSAFARGAAAEWDYVLTQL